VKIKKFLKILVTGLCLSGLIASNANAAPNVTADATAEVVAAIAIVQDRALDFGLIIPAGSTGTLVIAATDAGTATPTTVTAVGAQNASGKFTVTGTGSNTFLATIDATSVLAGPSSSSMTATFSNSLASNIGTLSSGTLVFYIGGSLAVGASQTLGSYVGTHSVAVAYN